MTEPMTSDMPEEGINEALCYFESIVCNAVFYVMSQVLDPQTFEHPSVKERLEAFANEVTGHFASIVASLGVVDKDVQLARVTDGYEAFIGKFQEDIPQFVNALKLLSHTEGVYNAH